MPLVHKIEMSMWTDGPSAETDDEYVLHTFTTTMCNGIRKSYQPNKIFNCIK